MLKYTFLIFALFFLMISFSYSNQESQVVGQLEWQLNTSNKGKLQEFQRLFQSMGLLYQIPNLI